MTDQTIVAVYDTVAHAELAVQDLLAAQVPESAIQRHAQAGSYAGASSAPMARESHDKGFWSNLFGGEPDHDTAVYDRSVNEGATAVTVKAPEAHAPKVMEILESHQPIDIDDQAASYGMTQTSTRAPVADADMPRATEGGTIQLAEETLAVGKRVVNHGTTRIRRFVVETPVEEQVSLHEEHVTVDRRPVTDERLGADAFTDRTIEMTESSEEAVVSKSARVKEEIALRKDVTDRTETVRDTVRREDVEITKVPLEATSTTTTQVDPRTRKAVI